MTAKKRSENNSLNYAVLPPVKMVLKKREISLGWKNLSFLHDFKCEKTWGLLISGLLAP